ncbi:nucleotidyltransferase domain-containing protein [Candidatus Roizmanbacteria bacterium CG07_land_8_20_14_0_80_34_15]|uniref:Nucleotidyltransferase domain-containing protein n=1 Tax=Candidatus Roizmanbacteria bacterium CG07_land_8_20_14_0_80_34_15 TaxID=1974849 RepID=A0A2M6YV15_9BACT|nr:MAG: nucleotidyltransferase domain-containing protein [Candidatus Roizmanbacteria bacterium CG07_land_8_20_14_0_80_34_15]
MTNKIIQFKLNNIISQIRDKYKPEQIILFGSLARGEFNKDSDIDLLIIKDNVPSCGLERRWQLRKLIKKEGVPVDFLVIKKDEYYKKLKLEDPFIKTIISEGKVVYSI